MAIDAKVSFINQLEEAMANILTVEQMKKLRRETVGILDHFEMTEDQMPGAEKDDLLDCYLRAMKVQNRSAKTIKRYEYIIRKMMEWVKIPTRQITVHHLRNYLASMQDRGIKDSTMQGVRQVFTAYFNWLQRESLIEWNPTANLGSIKVAKVERKCYSEIELARLNMACENARDRAILLFLSSTGCRISEMTALNRDSINLEKCECLVHGKGNKERMAYFSEVTGATIREYLEERTDENEALFVGRRGRLQPDGVRIMLNRIAKIANVEHVHPHKFRRTRATELTRRGMPIEEVARILGHEKIDTTLRYVNITRDQVKADLRRFA